MVKYSDQEKRKYCQQVESRQKTHKDVMQETGMSKHQVKRWMEKYYRGDFGNHKQSETVLVIPDLHCPFEHQDALDFLRLVNHRFNPKEVVCLGDEVDFHAMSRWPTDPDGMSPGQELKNAIVHLQPFYAEFPVVKVCISNHTIRPQKLMKEYEIPRAFWPTYETMLNAPDGWNWAKEWVIDDVVYIHGDAGKGGKNGWAANTEIYHKSCVVGHWHSRAGVVYDNEFFNMNTGCLINPKAYAFDYAEKAHKKPNLGCGLVFGGKTAIFVPMHVDDNNRWIGTL